MMTADVYHAWLLQLNQSRPTRPHPTQLHPALSVVTHAEVGKHLTIHRGLALGC